MLYNVSIDDPDRSGNTALNSITSDTDLSIVRLLVNRGASVNTQNELRETPLLKAVRAENDEVAKYLISVHANVNANGEAI